MGQRFAFDGAAQLPPNMLFVYDIRFESKARGRDWRAVFEIRSDSDGDGLGSTSDQRAVGVEVTVVFAGRTYTGFTDSDGIFRTSWIGKLRRGAYYANVIDLALTDFAWNPLELDLEDDSLYTAFRRYALQ